MERLSPSAPTAETLVSRMRAPGFRWLASLPTLLATVAFVVDVFTPNGVLDGFLYVSAILVCVWIPNANSVFYTAAGLMPLMVLGFTLSPSGAPMNVAVANRCVAVGIIWLAAIAVWRSVRSTQDRNSALCDLGEQLRAAERIASQERTELSDWIRWEITPELQVLEWRLRCLPYRSRQNVALRAEAMILSRAIQRASLSARAKEIRLRRKGYFPPHSEHFRRRCADFGVYAP